MRQFTVLSETGLRTPEQFNALIIRQENGYPIRLSDVGRAGIGSQDDRNIVRVNGDSAVGLGVSSNPRPTPCKSPWRCLARCWYRVLSP